MKAYAVVLSFLLLVQLAFPQAVDGVAANASVAAQVPHLIRFSGVVKDTSGNPGIVGMTFSLYKDPQGGVPLWTEVQNVRPDSAGHYSVVLGSTTSTGVPAEVFASGEAQWLGVQPEGQDEQPRVLMVSVPYALKAVDAETLGGRPAAAFALASADSSKKASTTQSGNASSSPAIAGSGKANYLPLWTSTTNLGDSVMFQATSTNFIGIGTTTPAAALDVAGPADVRGALSLFPPASGSAMTISGTAFKISNKGVVTFASGQSFPGTGSITGVTAGTGLTGGGTSGDVTLSVDTTEVVTSVTAGTDLTGGGTGGNLKLNVDTTKVAQLAGANTFSGAQTVDANNKTSALTVTQNGSGTGITANSTPASGTTYGLVATTASTTSTAIKGLASATSGGSNGVEGMTNAANSTGTAGVAGFATASSGSSFGVYGESASTSGYGVLGKATATTGSNFGVAGETASTSGAAVLGQSSATTGDTIGTEGTAASNAGVGVYGEATSTSGKAFGMYGTSASTEGIGVKGTVTATSGSTYGVEGINASPNGYGVTGFSTDSTGTSYGVFGMSSGSTGIGAYGQAISASKTGAGPGVPIGAWGDTSGDGVGVYGSADDGEAFEGINNADNLATIFVQNESSNSGAIVLATYSNFGGYCDVDVSGNLTCNGTVSGSVPVNNGARRVALNAIQSPENWFEDFGSARLSNGQAVVNLDATFMDTVNTGMDYHVFLTPNGDCKGLFVAEKTATGFSVRELGGGVSSVAFDYRIVARRRGYEQLRMADLTNRVPMRSHSKTGVVREVRLPVASTSGVARPRRVVSAVSAPGAIRR